MSIMSSMLGFGQAVLMILLSRLLSHLLCVLVVGAPYLILVHHLVQGHVAKVSEPTQKVKVYAQVLVKQRSQIREHKSRAKAWQDDTIRLMKEAESKDSEIRHLKQQIAIYEQQTAQQEAGRVSLEQQIGQQSDELVDLKQQVVTYEQKTVQQEAGQNTLEQHIFQQDDEIANLKSENKLQNDTTFTQAAEIEALKDCIARQNELQDEQQQQAHMQAQEIVKLRAVNDEKQGHIIWQQKEVGSLEHELLTLSKKLNIKDREIDDFERRLASQHQQHVLDQKMMQTKHQIQLQANTRRIGDLENEVLLHLKRLVTQRREQAVLEDQASKLEGRPAAKVDVVHMKALGQVDLQLKATFPLMRDRDFQPRPYLQHDLGQGGIGAVVACRWKRKELVAKTALPFVDKMKEVGQSIAKQRDVAWWALESLAREVKMHDILRTGTQSPYNEHVVKAKWYAEYTEADGKISRYLFMDRWPGFADPHEHFGDFTDLEALDLLEHIVRGIKVCREKGICHNDIKPGNVLFRNHEKPIWMLTDFGISTFSSDELQHSFSGSVNYCAPERFPNQYGQSTCTHPGDVWAASVVFLTSRGLVYGADFNMWDPAACKLRIDKVLEAAHGDEPFRNLAKRCLERDYRRRANADEVLTLLRDPIIAKFCR